MTLGLSLFAAGCILCALGGSPRANRLLVQSACLTRLRKTCASFLERYEWVCFTLLLFVGATLRFALLRQVPTGLSADEMLIAVQGRALVQTRTDMAGTHLPVFLPGYGASTAMGPLLPLLTTLFTSILGLSFWGVRLPALLIGMSSLVFGYLLAKKMGGRAMALCTLFVLTLSPWHIAASRFLNVPLAALTLLTVGCLMLLSGRLLIAGVIFGLSMYLSDSFWLVSPLLIAGYSIYLGCKRKAKARRLVTSLSLYFLISLPAFLTIWLNLMGRPSISLLGLTIPALPVSPQVLHTIFQSGFSFNAIEDTFFALLEWLICAVKSDDFGGTNSYLLYNSGLIYLFSLPMLLTGLLGAFGHAHRQEAPFVLLILLTCLCALPRLLCPTLSIEHLFILYLPVTLLVAFAICTLSRRMRLSILGFTALYIVSGSLMVSSYWNGSYAYDTESEFRTGFMEAARFAESAAPEQIVVTSRMYPCVDAQRLGEAMTRFAFDLPASAPLGKEQAYCVTGLDETNREFDRNTVYIASQDDLDFFDWDLFDFDDFGLYTVLTPIASEESGVSPP